MHVELLLRKNKGIEPSTRPGSERLMYGKKRQGGLARADGKGATAGKAPPVVEDLEVKGFAQCGTGGAAGAAGHQPGEDGTRETAAHRSDRTAERADGSAGLCA
ncbi:hypothetical protein [Burkholderia catarinensis]|uniref:hypothetical protein n=1 Tax=Burkholderia catarinensis TaxID=1108140 RepID=UPI00091824F2|nr:hypothetical protein [Burkholderia catarinensis]